MATVKDWSKYHPYFTEDEFRCSHTGECHMDEDFMDMLLAIRLRRKKAMNVTSGFRARSHPLERNKAKGGAHTHGKAVDIACDSTEAWHIASIAFKLGFQAIGVSQETDNARFLHLEYERPEGFPSPVLYSYL